MNDFTADIFTRALFVAFIGIMMAGAGAAHASQISGTLRTAATPSPQAQPGYAGQMSGSTGGGTQPATHPDGSPSLSASPDDPGYAYTAYPSLTGIVRSRATLLPGAPAAGGPIAHAADGSNGLGMAAAGGSGATASVAEDIIILAAGLVGLLAFSLAVVRRYGY